MYQVFFTLFSDNTNDFLSHRSIDTLLQTGNAELVLVADWLRDKILTVNLDKTNYVLLKRKL